VRTDAVWFLQFWVNGPRDGEELGVVKMRVKDRRDGKEGFVEDAFMVRFCKMMGLPVRGRQEREERTEKEELLDLVARGREGVDVERWREDA
jgi:hypothetical protein